MAAQRVEHIRHSMIDLGSYHEVIPDPPVPRQPALHQVLVAQVPPQSAKLLSGLMKFLVEALPSTSLKHFKRASKRADGTHLVLLCPTSQGPLPERVVAFLAGDLYRECTIGHVDLPLDAPLGTEEWQMWSRHWFLAIPPPRPSVPFKLAPGDERHVAAMMELGTPDACH
jgi:hypothetical protein